MDDLKERLRNREYLCGGDSDDWPELVNPDGPEAADRIQALEDALREQVRQCVCPDCEMCARHEALLTPITGEEVVSQVVIDDSGWAAVMADPKLQTARRKLSFHEIRLIMNHARARHPAYPCCSQLVGEAWVDGKYQPEFCPVHSPEEPQP